MVCNGCRAWIHGVVAEIPELYADLTADDPAEPTTWVTLDQQGRRSEHGPDPVNATLPAGPVAPIRLDAAVSGSREAPVPVNLDRIDLTAGARQHPAMGLTETGRDMAVDQVGHVAVASELNFWVGDLIEHRGLGEHRPSPVVRDLCDWLTVGGDQSQQSRLNDACDDYQAIDELATDLRQLHGTLTAATGGVDVPDYKIGVACPHCYNLGLYRLNGGTYIECSECPGLLDPDEYERWVNLSAAEEFQRCATVIGWMLFVIQRIGVSLDEYLQNDLALV